MHRIKRICYLISIACLASTLLLLSPVGVAAATTTVSIDAPADVLEGANFVARVIISDVVNFDACNYDISFDDSVLEVTSVSNGNIGGTTIPVDMWGAPAGTLTVIQNVPGISGVSGSGFLADIHFHVIGSGGSTSHINLLSGFLGDNAAHEIPADWVDDSVQVTSALSANFSATPLSGNEPSLTVNFTDTSSTNDGIVSWSWNFGDGATSTEQNPSHVYTAEGTYTVSLTVEEADSDSDTKTRTNYITVNDTGPSASFSATPLSGDDPLTVTFTDASTSYDGIDSWSWNFGDGATSTEQNPSHIYTAEGTYTVSLTVTENDDDSNTKTRTNYVMVGDTGLSADFSATPLSGDDPLTVSFTDISSSDDGIVSWLWDFGDGNTSTEQNPSHVYTTEGTYTVSLTVTEDDDDSATKARTNYITVGDTGLSADFSATPLSGENPLTVSFTDTSSSSDGIVSWLWDFGDGNTGTEQNPSHEYSTEGIYTVSLTVTEDDSDSATKTRTNYITVGDTGPSADFSATPLSGDDFITVSFTDASSSSDGIVSWLWDFGDGNTGTEQSPSHEYSTEGIYTISLTVTEADSDSDTKTRTNYITVADTKPSANFTAMPRTGEDSLAVTFTDTSNSSDGINNWLWDFGDGYTSTEQNPSHEYSTEGTYTVSLTVTEADSDTDTDTKTYNIIVMVKEAQSSLSWIVLVAGLGGLGVLLVTSSAIIITKRR